MKKDSPMRRKYHPFILLILFMTFISSCQTYYIPDVYQTDKSMHPDKSTNSFPITQKIDDFELISFPESINRSNIDNDVDVYVGISNSASDAYGSFSKPYKTGQTLFFDPGRNIIAYFYEYNDIGSGKTYQYFIINLNERTPGKQVLRLGNMNNMTMTEIEMDTLSYDKNSYGFEWEAVSLELSLYIHVKMNSKPNSTDVSFLCIDTSNQDSLLSILTDEAIYSHDGYHLVTGLDKAGKTKEENDKISIDLFKEETTSSITQEQVDKKTAYSYDLLAIPAGDKPILTVMDLSKEGISDQEAIFISDYLSSCLFDTKAFRIIDRSRRETILEEIEFSNTGCTDENCQIEIGKLLAADKIIVGSLGKIGNKFIMNTKLIEVSTGETISTGHDIFDSMDTLVEGCPIISFRIAEGYISSLK